MQQTFLIGSALVALAVLALVAAGVVTGQPVDPLTLARATSGFALIALGAVWVLWRRMEAALVAHKRALSDLGAREFWGLGVPKQGEREETLVNLVATKA